MSPPPAPPTWRRRDITWSSSSIGTVCRRLGRSCRFISGSSVVTLGPGFAQGDGLSPGYVVAVAEQLLAQQIGQQRLLLLTQVLAPPVGVLDGGGLDVPLEGRGVRELREFHH